MGVNLDKPHIWKRDIADSVRTYNEWFLSAAPQAFREQREAATGQVHEAMKRTGDLTRLGPGTLEAHPEVLRPLRMASCPPIARDRLIGLVGAESRSLVLKMEKDGALPPRMPPAERRRHLEQIERVLTGLLDQDVCPWIAEGRPPTDDERRVATVVIADRLCGTMSDPIIRSAQEERQLDGIRDWLAEREYVRVPSPEADAPASMLAGSFALRMNVEGSVDEHGVKTVNIPVDVVVKPRSAASGDLPIFVEAKSAGDFANVNKRRKEEAAKANQLRNRHGSRVRLVLFLGGYFDSAYLGYEAAEGIDWVWEHRIDDLAELGL